MTTVAAIAKVLSANDVGSTGTHQAGMLVPRSGGVLNFFPQLNPESLNPRRQIAFCDDAGRTWHFTFIYYNNRIVGGTRNEYRLTHMTEFIRAHDLRAGDAITLSRDTDGQFRIGVRRSGREAGITDGTLRLGTRWRVVSI